MTPTNLTVLVVDDDITIRSYMEKMLLTVGVNRTITAASWLEVVEILDKQPIDGAFLDLVLQRGSGLDIGRELVSRNIPVVFCTGVADEFNTSQMLDLGWIIPKPVRLAGIRRGLSLFHCLKNQQSKTE